MTRKRKTVLVIALIGMLVASGVVYAANIHQYCYLSSSTKSATGTLDRTESTGNVTARTTITFGDNCKPAVEMRVTDITYGVQSFGIIFGSSFVNSSVAHSYTPPYLPSDTIGASSSHYLCNNTNTALDAEPLGY